MSAFEKRKKPGRQSSSDRLREELRDILGESEEVIRRKEGPSIYPGLEDRGIGSVVHTGTGTQAGNQTGPDTGPGRRGHRKDPSGSGTASRRKSGSGRETPSAMDAEYRETGRQGAHAAMDAEYREMGRPAMDADYREMGRQGAHAAMDAEYREMGRQGAHAAMDAEYREMGRQGAHAAMDAEYRETGRQGGRPAMDADYREIGRQGAHAAMDADYREMGSGELDVHYIDRGYRGNLRHDAEYGGRGTPHGGRMPDSGRQVRTRRRSKGPYLIISCVTVLLFLMLIGHLVRFNVSLKDDIINSPYNRRQNMLSQYVVRGAIRSIDGATLAYTETDEEGNENRVYPYGRLFAHAVGFVTHGKSGMESKYNYDLLTSHSNLIDMIINDFLSRKNKGDTVVTTIHARFQEACYEILGDYRGAIIAIEPKTGAIRAMVSKPDFNPNTLAEEWDDMVSDPSNSQLLNRATQGLYAPGSTFKLLTALAWYDKYHRFDNLQFNCTGEFPVGEITVHCFESIAHGEEDVTRAFIQSCNTAFSQMGLDLGSKALTSIARKMMFGEKLPFDLLSSRSRWNLTSSSTDEELVQTAFGQGKTLVTPYHMALIVSAIANNGVLMKPCITDHIENAAGTRIRSTAPTAYRTLLGSDEAAQLQALMADVVREGTASYLSDRSYGVAGKTGSAEYNRSDGSIGTHSWFVGYSNPADPELVVVVLAENGGAGSTTAVPMAGEVLDAWYALK